MARGVARRVPQQEDEELSPLADEDDEEESDVDKVRQICWENVQSFIDQANIGHRAASMANVEPTAMAVSIVGPSAMEADHVGPGANVEPAAMEADHVRPGAVANVEPAATADSAVGPSAMESDQRGPSARTNVELMSFPASILSQVFREVVIASHTGIACSWGKLSDGKL
ncbi:unnamed protein product [Symbiodinium sp. CCMP2592]|nr:unnamed protein product [Symbiodinium sp. CCMP2592]